MPYAPFHEKFPELAERETRVLIATNHPVLPPGVYPLVESYCDESDCDCRRVFLNIFREQTRTLEAVVAYGWESRKFYTKWMGDSDPRMLDALQGPCLNLSSQVTPLSNVLLKEVTMILEDASYVERLKRHYKMYRDEIDRASGKNSSEPPADQGATVPRMKVGRNDSCPCGSGKKFKRCCGV